MQSLRAVAIVADLRRAVRAHLREPVFAAALVLTVGAGAGGSAAILAFVGGFGTGPAVSGVDATQFARVKALLVAATALVLLLATATVAGLLLSRAAARVKETAVKICLGASRRRLVWEAVLESLVVSIAGGLIATVVGLWTSRVVPLLLFAEDAEQMHWQPSRLWLTLVMTVWVVVIAACGLAPASAISQQTPVRVLQTDWPGVSGSARRFRTWLVVAQIALCVLLVEMAGLIRDDLHQTLRSDRGRRLGALLVAPIEASAGSFDDVDGLAYFARVGERARGVGGVTGAAWISTLPGARAAAEEFAVEPPALDWREVRFDVKPFDVDTGFPRRVVAGRLFGIRDATGSCPAVVIDESAARRYFDGDAIGRPIKGSDGTTMEVIGVVTSAPDDQARPILFCSPDSTHAAADRGRDIAFSTPAGAAVRVHATLHITVASPEYFALFADPTIAGRPFSSADGPAGCHVGVVTRDAASTVFGGSAVGGAVVDRSGDRIEIVGVVRAEALGSAQRDPAETLLVPLQQAYAPLMTLAIRTAAQPEPQIISTVDSALRTVSGGEVRAPLESLEARLARTSLAPEKIAVALLSASALLGLLVSLAGVYAVMADSVARRRRELALRVALGARAWRLIAGIVREGFRLAAYGAAAGAAAALAGAPLLDHLLLHARLPGLNVLIVAAAAVAALVAVATVLPAWRAVSVDPKGLIQAG